jgi:hypothetical protein
LSGHRVEIKGAYQKLPGYWCAIAGVSPQFVSGGDLRHPYHYHSINPTPSALACLSQR